jgi:hypothetical protein
MLVEELIAHLQAGNPKAKVVRKGHFGEDYPMTVHDFPFRYQTDGRYDDPTKCQYLEVEPPDIGPEPD